MERVLNCGKIVVCDRRTWERFIERENYHSV